jgi:hypothetical protein
MTWDGQGEGLDARLCDLEARIQRGSYRAQPSLRADISKPDGRERPLGIAAQEDKIVQRATVEALNAVYETDFLGFTHICSRSRRGGFLLSRRTRRDRKRAKLPEISEDLRRRWHQDVAEQGRWPGSVVRASSPTTQCPRTFTLSRHSATMSSNCGGAPYAGAARRIERRGPAWTGWRIAGCQNPGYLIPGHRNAFAPNTQGGSRMREFRPYGSVRRVPVMDLPTAIERGILWAVYTAPRHDIFIF